MRALNWRNIAITLIDNIFAGLVLDGRRTHSATTNTCRDRFCDSRNSNHQLGASARLARVNPAGMREGCVFFGLPSFFHFADTVLICVRTLNLYQIENKRSSQNWPADLQSVNRTKQKAWRQLHTI